MFYNTYKEPSFVCWRDNQKERNACTVLALHYVTGRSLDDCKLYMARHGRKYQSGMIVKEIESALFAMKSFKVKKGPYTEQNRICVSKFCKLHNKGVYYVLVRGHAFAVKDGVVFDYKLGGRRQVVAAYRIYKLEEL